MYDTIVKTLSRMSTFLGYGNIGLNHREIRKNRSFFLDMEINA